MKTHFTKLTVALLATLVMSACGGGYNSTTASYREPALVVDASGYSSFNSTALGLTLVALPIETISVAEQASLALMREEEKLAHDVYAQMDTRWGASTQVFGNIANSEATHTEAVRQLLLRYSLVDPAGTLAAGLFQNTTLQDLYTQLVASGATSLIDALKVGAAIEEIDMLDINTGLLSVDNEDIRLVYDSLLKGSRNHLRSFVNTLLNQGVTYVPQYMDALAYAAIISTPIER
jgi:hypothetical protein